jgi:hypothetical protein
LNIKQKKFQRKIRRVNTTYILVLEFALPSTSFVQQKIILAIKVGRKRTVIYVARMEVKEAA